MHAATAREIHDPQGVQDPRGLPEPVSWDAVHHGVDQREEAVRVEVTSARA